MEHRYKALIRKYIQGNCTPAELKELQKFMSNPDAQLLFDQVLEENWTGLKAEADLNQPHLDQKLKQFYQQLHLQAEAGLQEQESQQVKTHFIKLRKYLSYAAILGIVIAGLGTYMVLKFPKAEHVAQVAMRQMSNPNGQRSTITLPDSSEVFLGAGSTLRFPEKFAGNTREITLEGEAFFQVTKNKHKPFIIHTGAVQTKVLGTSFKIEAFKNLPLVVAVATGKVRVDEYLNHRHKSLAILTPGQKVMYVNGQAETGEANIADVKSWKDARLVFEKQSLKAITTQLQRWYNVNIVFENKAKAGEQISVVLNANVPLNKIMKVLSATGHFKYKIQSKNVTIN